MTKETTKKTGLELLREPFPANQISKLPKPTKKQTDDVKADYKAGVRCKICNGWHHPDVIHLDYVGHAALTDRLLDCDPTWFWEPVSFDQSGSPFLDNKGGLWIRLTVCGVSRLGYGHPDGKTGGDAVKEAIGDALRNAGMRFGAALDLWHKGELHLDDSVDTKKTEPNKSEKPPEVTPEEKKAIEEAKEKLSPIFEALKGASSEKVLNTILDLHKELISTLPKQLKTWFDDQVEIKRGSFNVLKAG